MKALITKVNSPKVTILIGSVNISKRGLTIAFKIPKTTATNNAVWKSFIRIPGNIYAVITIDKALTIQFTISCIIPSY